MNVMAAALDNANGSKDRSGKTNLKLKNKTSVVSISKTKKDMTNLNPSTSQSAESIPASAQKVTVPNKNNKSEIINFASDEMLETIQVEDSTVEIVGFVDEIDGPKNVGKEEMYTLLKFLLNNNSRHRIQVVAWNEEVERVKHHLQPNRIIHIDGAKAKIPKVSDFNHGTLPFELIIRSNTIINSLGEFNIKDNIQIKHVPIIELIDIPDYLNQYIFVQGFIKTNFNALSNNQKTFGYGSITNGVHKLQIQIMNYEQTTSFEKGEQVQVKGIVKVTNDIFFLNVENISDIKLLNEKTLSFAECLKGTKPIKRSLNITDTAEERPKKVIRIY